MRKLLKFALFSILLFYLQSCNKCNNSAIEFTSLEEEYGCSNTIYDLEIDLENDFTVIQSQETYEQKVTGNCNAIIDFDKFDLIIGKYEVTRGVDKISYSLEQNCKNNDLELYITVQMNDATVITDFTYHILVPNIKGGSSINMQMSFE